MKQRESSKKVKKLFGPSADSAGTQVILNIFRFAAGATNEDIPGFLARRGYLSGVNITYLPIPPESPTGRLLSEFLDVESGENQGRQDSPAVR